MTFGSRNNSNLPGTLNGRTRRIDGEALGGHHNNHRCKERGAALCPLSPDDMMRVRVLTFRRVL
jgi:hypothetical protein